MKNLTLIVVMMAVTLLVSCCAVVGDVITVDPNASGTRQSATDTRLTQKISYECKSKPTREVIDDLSSITGVTFISGKNRLDWQVRDAKMNIFVKDVSLAELMNSIARVMHFRWSHSDKGSNWSYRLVDDDEAVRKVEAKLRSIEQDLVQARKQTLREIREVAGLSEDEVDKLKSKDPHLYYLAKTGMARAYVNLAHEVPGLEEAAIRQTDFFVPRNQLSAKAQQAILDFAHASWRRRHANQNIAPEQEEYLSEYGVVIKPPRTDQLVRASANGIIGMVGLGSSKDHYGLYSMTLEDPSNPAIKTIYKYRVKSLISREEEDAAWRAITKEDQKAIDAIYQAGFVEQVLIHPDYPELKQKVSLKSKGIISKVLEQTARTCGLNLVADNYKTTQLMIARIASDKEEIGSVLDKFARMGTDQPIFNWEKRSSIVEISHRNWYMERQKEIPDAWMEKWRNTIRETGTLDLEQLAEMAKLTDDQYFTNVFDDTVLKNNQLTNQIYRSGEYLKVYATLSKSQRSALVSNAGLSMASLNEAQQKAIYRLISGVSMPDGLPDLMAASLDMRLTASRVQQGKRYVYTFRGTINSIPLPGEYILSTPQYKTTEEIKAKEQ